MVISPVFNSEKTKNFDILDNNRIPYVTVDRTIESANKPFVRSDDLNGGYIAVEHLVKRGYKKIAIIKGESNCSISNARLEGYRRALEDYGLPFRPGFVKSCQTDIDNDGYYQARELLLSANRPDAFFTINDNIAVGIYKAAKELGLNIPNDIGVVGYSNSLLSNNIIPALSTVEQPGIEMGEQAFDFLQQSIIGNHQRLNRTFEARLITRDSSNRLFDMKINSTLKQFSQPTS